MHAKHSILAGNIDNPNFLEAGGREQSIDMSNQLM